MDGLREIDNISKTMPRHKIPSAVDDEYNTPDEVYYQQTKHYDIVCELDPFTKEWEEGGHIRTNSKCLYNFTIRENGLAVDWLLPDGSKPTGVWVNHPHSLHVETLSKNLEQWRKFDLDILTIIPSNTVRPPYWSYYVNQYLNKGLIVEPLVDRSRSTNDTGPYFVNESGDPIYNKKGDMLGRGGYLNFKKKSEDSQYDSRNGYLIIRYFSKKSWTRFIKKRIGELSSYGV